MKQNINKVTWFSIKEGARIESTLFKAKQEIVTVKLEVLKRNFPNENFFINFLRPVLSRFCE